MQNKKLKLSLSIQHNETDGIIDYQVSPDAPFMIQGDTRIYHWDHDPKKTTKISIIIKANQGQRSHLQITDVNINGIKLNNIEKWSRYISKQGCLKNTHGYLSIPGEFIMTIHQNPLVHNYMAYFLSTCQP